MPTHNITRSWSRNGESIAKTYTVTAGGEKNVSETIPAATTHHQVLLAFDKDNLKSVFISSDVDLTMKTNSTGSPATTLTITAGNPIQWDANCGHANPFSAADVTTCYFTNADADEDATLEIRILEDVTP